MSSPHHVPGETDLQDWHQDICQHYRTRDQAQQVIEKAHQRIDVLEARVKRKSHYNAQMSHHYFVTLGVYIRLIAAIQDGDIECDPYVTQSDGNVLPWIVVTGPTRETRIRFATWQQAYEGWRELQGGDK